MSTVLSGMFIVRFYEEPHLGQKIPEMLHGKSKLERKSKEKLLWGSQLTRVMSLSSPLSIPSA